MQVYADALFMQRFEFTEEINHASIIGGPGNIAGYYMEVFSVNSIGCRRPAAFFLFSLPVQRFPCVETVFCQALVQWGLSQQPVNSGCDGIHIQRINQQRPLQTVR